MLAGNSVQIIPAIIEENENMFPMQPSNKSKRYPEY
jgi:hypothetical protein